MRADEPLAAIAHLADVGSVAQDVADLAARPGGHRVGVVDRHLRQLGGDHVDRAMVVGVEVEDQPHVLGFAVIDGDDAAAVDPLIAIAVGRHADEQSAGGAAGQSFHHIDRLLLRVEAGHAGQHAPLHPARRRVLRRLADRDQRDVERAFNPLKLDVIEQVSGSPVDLVEQHPVERLGMVLRVGDHLLERGAFVGLAGRLGDAIQLDDGAAGAFGVTLERVHLHVQAEAFTLLLAAGNAGQRNESLLLHGVGICSVTCDLLHENAPVAGAQGGLRSSRKSRDFWWFVRGFRRKVRSTAFYFNRACLLNGQASHAR
ncbi:MAG TPA: hypothetical protein VLI90_13180 [Tepidisphaeraceae bacterium]|nr:hypothetical protein [Tepidisphaeraceae bacterium]